MRELRGPLSFSSGIHPTKRKDALPLLLLTVIYAVTAFWNLGSFKDPQTFQAFTESHTVEFSLDREISFSKLEY
jgi:hypothetical protein